MLKPTYDIPNLPLDADFETREVLRALSGAHRFLAELKGRASSIPNQGILIDTLSLQEAKASSEIENIVTTQDEIFRTNELSRTYVSAEAKEVANYRLALKTGFERLRQRENIISCNSIIEMYQVLKNTTAGLRETPGTTLANDRTGEIVYVPPQRVGDIHRHMANLEAFINDESLSDLDPLLKLAVIHHQFESIHPFSDGNGRIGRILNVLYLTQKRLLETPVLYLSRYITQNKDEYYQLLQSTRDTGDWVPWVLFMLRAITQTSRDTLQLVGEIKNLMAKYKERMRSEHGKLYSQDLLNNLFRHPYTRIEYVVEELDLSRQTAARHLDQLTGSGMLQKIQQGRNNYYVNVPLVRLFVERFPQN